MKRVVAGLFLTGAMVGLSLPAFADSRSPASLNQANQFKNRTTDECFGQCESGKSVSVDLVESFRYAQSQPAPVNNQMAPTDLNSNTDANTALTKVADKSLQYWWNSSEAKNTSIGHGITSVEKGMNQEVVLGKGEIKHKVDFSVDTFQTTARLRYEGYTNAEMAYQVRDSSTDVQMTEKVGKTKDLVLGQKMSPQDSLSHVSMKWNW